MKIIQVNSVYGYGSTGGIVKSIHEHLLDEGHSSYVFYGRKKNISSQNIIYISSRFSFFFHLLWTRLLSLHGYGSIIPTLKMIKRIKTINPDIIHFHNIHGYYLNIPLLNRFLKKTNYKLCITVHDDWLISEKIDFVSLPLLKFHKQDYPKSFIYLPKLNNRMKQRFINQVHLKFVFPSLYMKNEFIKNDIKNSRTEMIHNGIDIDLFNDASNIRKSMNLENYSVYLSVSSHWNQSKGIGILIGLSKLLSTNERVIIIGQSNRIFPENIIHLNHVNDKKQLANIYKSADVFINPTLKDNFPTVNIEALASGLPIIAFDTGGNSEIITGDNVGKIVYEKNPATLYQAIKDVTKSKGNKHIDKDKILEFDRKSMIKRYIQLYEKTIIENRT